MPPAPASPRILISDDQPDVLEALRLLLKAEGLHTEAVTSPSQALTALQEERAGGRGAYGHRSSQRQGFSRERQSRDA